jgi:parallel beta-helix repeat protein
MKKPILLLPLILIILMPAASAEFYEFTPTGDDNYINNDTVINFSSSPYMINDPNSNGVLIINTSDITLDCNGSQFVGNGDGSVIYNYGFDNITITNCNISGYYFQIYYLGNEGRIIENNFSNYLAFGLELNESFNSVIESNRFSDSAWGAILLFNTESTLVKNNTIEYNKYGIGVFSSSKNITFSENSIKYNDQYGIFINSSEDISFSLDVVTDNYFSDVILFNALNISLGTLSYGNITVGWDITLNVTDSDSNPIHDALIEIFDKDGSFLYWIKTINGLRWTSLSEYIINSSGQYYSTPHTFNVSKDGYLNATKIVDVNESKIVHITLSPPAQDTTPPNISVDIDPFFVLLGENVSITVNASDNSSDIDTIIISITNPNSTTEYYNFTGLGLPEVNLELNHTPSLEGIHSVRISASDTDGNEASISSEFIGVPGFLDITSTVRGHDQIMNTTLTLYLSGASEGYLTLNSQVGDFLVLNTPDMTHDILFSGHNDSISVLLKEVNISENNASHISLDLYDNTDPGYGDIYAIETNYTFTSSELTLYYDGGDFSDESDIELYRCADWNFSNRTCNATWEGLIANEYNMDEDYIRFTVTGFSAFTMRESTVSICGDGVCQSDETPDSCGADCACLTGEARSCSQTRQGICSIGDEECVAGIWTGCDPPVAEVCNGLDDDCDGIIDNIGGFTTVDETQCGCFNGLPPGNEVCDGIDNDCDGTIDDYGDCCVTGDTRNCGPPSQTGICQYGTSSCINNVWGDCVGGVFPESTEKCFNNLDDNCNGEVDEFCDHCTNNIMDYNEEGVDCGGSCSECRDIISDYLPYILIGMGVSIIAVLLVLYLYFRKQGRELTWEELMKKYTHSFLEPQTLQ